LLRPGYEGLAAHLSTKGRGKGTWFDPAPGLRTLHPQGRAPEPWQLPKWYTFQQHFFVLWKVHFFGTTKHKRPEYLQKIKK